MFFVCLLSVSLDDFYTLYIYNVRARPFIVFVVYFVLHIERQRYNKLSKEKSEQTKIDGRGTIFTCTFILTIAHPCSNRSTLLF